MGDLYATINATEESTRKNQDYWSVVRNRLYGLLSQLGETINCSKGMDIEKLLQHPVVLEVDGLGREEANFLVLLLFYWIYGYRKAQGHRGTLRHVLIIGEAKRIFTASEQYSQTTAEFSGIPPADLIVDEIRDFGESIVTEDQEPTKLSSSLKANSYVKLCGSLGSGRDIDDIAHAMDLDEEERNVITKLERGEWLVKLSGRYVKPFTIRTEDFPLEKTITDAELHERMDPILLQFMQKEEARELEAPTTVEGSIVLPGLSQDAWALLVNTKEHPFYALTSRQRELKLSGRRIETVKQELIDAGLINESNILLTYRRINFLILTNKALTILANVGHDVRLWHHIGNVGHEHMAYQWFIAASLRSLGYEAKIEARLGNRRIDVLAEKDGRRIGIEVEVTTFDLQAKLEGIEQLDELIILAKDLRFLEVMRAQLSQQDTLKEKIRLGQIQQYMREISKIASEADGRSLDKGNKPDNSPERKEDGRSPGETNS